MELSQIYTLLGIIGLVATGAFWLIDAKFITPLNMTLRNLDASIDNVNLSVKRLEDVVDKMQEKDERTRNALAKLDSDVQNLSRRTDSMDQRLGKVEARQIEIYREVGQ